MIATPNADVTAGQASDALSQGWKPAPKEPAVISTEQGMKAIKEATEKHNADMAGLATPKPTTDTKSTDPEASDAMKSAGGVTAEEAKATGIDLNNYNYDSGTGYFLPKNGTQGDQRQFEDDKRAISSAFEIQGQQLDAATQNLISSITGIYTDRMNAQKDVNMRNEAATNTTNIRGGTSRYAGGVANSILTAQENYGLQKLNEIGHEEANLIATAQENLANKKYTVFINNRDAIDKLRTERNTKLKDLQDRALTAQKEDKQYKLDLAKFQETEDQDAFERAFKTEQNAIDREKIKAQYGTGTIAGTIQVPSVQMTAQGTPDPVGQKAVLDQITAKYGPMTAEAIKGLANYSRLPSDFSVRPTKGMNRADAVSLAQMLDPTYTEAGAPARQAYMKSLASGPIYNATISANKAINHLISFADTVSKLPNTSPFSSMNKIDQSIVQPFDKTLQENISKAETEKNGVQLELAKFFKGSGATDVKSVEDWNKSLDTGANPAHLKGTIQGAIDLFAGQVNVMNQAYTNTMGKNPDGAILQPETISKLSELKNKGYTVDIPGVYYSDPVAYTNASPENVSKLAEVRSAHPDLSPTQATQLAQYLQENGQ